ncbi:winged helix-turn-helix transcriptional regulator [Streptomyces sp. NPDC006197]|uniref:winged helix-turn-helix transcriptional regulator n=1 Tax=Streptomyces sp. NPDC006197 TaxID=3156685 RepID=UPI0033B786C9
MTGRGTRRETRRGIEYCPVTAGVEAVVDRWTLLVLRELLLGSERFNDLHRGLPGISRSLLSARLRRMRGHGLVARTTTPAAVRRAGHLRLDGDPDLVAAFPTWFAWRTPHDTP